MKCKLDKNMCDAKFLAIPGKDLLPTEAILKGVRPIYATNEAGERTGRMTGIRYDLIDASSLTSFTIRYEGDGKSDVSPVITQDEIDASPNHVVVSVPVESVYARPWKIDFGKATLTIISSQNLSLKRAPAQVQPS